MQVKVPIKVKHCQVFEGRVPCWRHGVKWKRRKEGFEQWGIPGIYNTNIDFYLPIRAVFQFVCIKNRSFCQRVLDSTLTRMASRRQSPRLSRQALTDTTQARLSLRRSLISKYSNDATEIKSESVPVELPKAIKNPRANGRSVKRQGNEPTSPPDNWKLVFDAIKEYRKSTLAPVDTMGCERLSERHVDEKVLGTTPDSTHAAKLG